MSVSYFSHENQAVFKARHSFKDIKNLKDKLSRQILFHFKKVIFMKMVFMLTHNYDF